MTEITADDLVANVRGRNSKEFKLQISRFLLHGNVMDVICQCNEDEVALIVEWCRRESLYLFHRIFEKVENVNDLYFVKSTRTVDRVDSEKRTWLHTAVMHHRALDILRYLVLDLDISVLCQDDYGYTPLHYYCQREQYDIEVLKLLMFDETQLTQPSKDDLTPLEFACSHPENLRLLRCIPNVNIKQLLRKIDKVSEGFVDVKGYPLMVSLTTERIWLNLLQKNDKYMLLSYIKSDENFASKYYFEPNEMLTIMKKCPENGPGILSYIRDRFLKEDNPQKLSKILFQLTGVKGREGNEKRTFSQSALFLALLTGRFELISPLLRCCQFDIVPNGMLICMVCTTFISRKVFPDQVVKDILDLKDFCEQYTIAVITRTYNKDLSEGKIVTGSYMNRKSRKLDKKSIMEVAYNAKCDKYLGIPCCQESLTQVWREKTMKGPQIKFILHSLMHIIFLVLFSFVVVNNLFGTISPIEGFCYFYGLGYCMEEVRQIWQVEKGDFFTSYIADAANVIDIFAIVFMFLGFILRVSLTLPKFEELGELKLFIESRHTFLFVQRLILCLSLLAFFMRVLYFASLTRILGPKLKMINTMITRDLIPLLFIFSIFLTAFGVIFQSLLFPNSYYTKETTLKLNITMERKNIISLLADIFRRATFTIFDFHYTLNEVENIQNIYVADGYGQYAVYFLLLIFMVVVNVMLMNLLIALFSNTVSRIILESKQSWKSSRYGFIQEYADRTLLPPPFNIIMIAIEVVRHFMRRYRHRSSDAIAKRRDEENVALQLVPQDNETPDESSLSYYIYQAFAMSGERFRLLKDAKDLEYEKEVHFQTIEEKLEINKNDLEKTINEKCSAIQENLNAHFVKKTFANASIVANFN